MPQSLDSLLAEYKNARRSGDSLRAAKMLGMIRRVKRGGEVGSARRGDDLGAYAARIKREGKPEQLAGTVFEIPRADAEPISEAPIVRDIPPWESQPLGPTPERQPQQAPTVANVPEWGGKQGPLEDLLPAPEEDLQMLMDQDMTVTAQGMPPTPPTSMDERVTTAMPVGDEVAAIQRFRDSIMQRESGGDQYALGQEIQSGPMAGQQAMGMYQFMPSTLQDLVQRMVGYEDARGLEPEQLQQEFLADNLFQEDAMDALMGENAQTLGTTDPAALAAAHYGGPGAAQQYLDSGQASQDPSMSTGTAFPSVADYIGDFAGGQDMGLNVDDLLSILASGRHRR